MILQPLLHLQIIPVFLKGLAVCKMDKVIIPSARTNPDTRNPLRRGSAPWMRDRPGEDKLDASLKKVTIENMRFATFYYEPTRSPS